MQDSPIIFLQRSGEAYHCLPSLALHVEECMVSLPKSTSLFIISNAGMRYLAGLSLRLAPPLFEFFT